MTQNNIDDTQSMTVSERIALARKRRRDREQQQYRSLGEDDDDNDDEQYDANNTDEPQKKKQKTQQQSNSNNNNNNSALAWVNKSRNLEREKKLAEQRALEQEELEQAALSMNQPKYETKDLVGLKINHDQRMFGSEEVILTLKDANVLDEDAQDELENVHLVQQEKKQWNKQRSFKRNKVLDAIDALENDNLLDGDEHILPQYNSVVDDETFKPKKSFTITSAEESARTQNERLNKLRAKLAMKDKESTSAAAVYSLDKTVVKNVTSDFMTNEESPLTIERKEVKVKKKKRVSSAKIRQSKDQESQSESSSSSSVLESLLSSPAINSSSSASGHHGSRNYRAKVSTVNIIDDDETIPLIRQPTRSMKADEIVAENMRLFEQEEQSQIKEEPLNTVTFDATTEFVRHINIKTEEEEEFRSNEQITPILPRPVVKTEEEGSTEPSTNHSMPPPSSLLSIKKKNIRANVRSSRDVDEEDEPIVPSSASFSTIDIKTEDHVDVVEEPIVATGLAATLAFAKQKGFINQQDYGGRSKDKKVLNQRGVLHSDDTDDSDIKIEYRDEFGRIMTPKETFRVMSHKYHGEGPGKNKLEKQRKKYMEEMKRKRMSDTDTPLKAMETLERVQKATSLPYVVIDEKNLGALAAGHKSTSDTTKTSNKDKSNKKRRANTSKTSNNKPS